jgi:hypothetical protein
MATRNPTKPKRQCPSKVRLDPRKCLTCEKLFTPNRFWHGYCSTRCRDKAKERKAREREPKLKRKSTNSLPFGSLKCPVCEDEFTATRSGQRYCSHRCFRLRLQRNWRNKNRAKGLCYSCTDKPIRGSVSYCEKHWFIQAAWRSGLRGRGSWEKLKKILEGQNYKCPYTGRRLTPGVNASVDHKKPRSLSRGSVGLVENLEWVDTEVNRAKRTLTKRKFVALCKLIASRFP